MSELRKAHSDLTHFLTFSLVGWIDLFTRKECCDIAIESLKYCQINKGLEIYGYVIMPSHIHLVCKRTDGKRLSDFIRDFKSFTSKQFIQFVETDNRESRKDWLLHMFRFHAKYNPKNEEFQVWQNTSYPVELYNNTLIDQKINYTHQNPVRAGIVTEESYYHYSGANPFSPLKVVVP